MMIVQKFIMMNYCPRPLSVVSWHLSWSHIADSAPRKEGHPDEHHHQ